ncbi:putative Acyl-CoA N-acyltransferase [Seiridium cardinale]|uniref:histone acetyltransferase n=1 Tax=Seiridium cardinale TaxID=138064 RepID=A0ABR2XHH6_9PEZI
MAQQKRKQPHDETAATAAAPRRATRHTSAAASTEPEKQRRTTRGRANTLDEPQYAITGSSASVVKRSDASKSKAAPAPPPPVPAKATRRTRGHTAESEAGADTSIVVRAAQPNGKKRSAQSQSSTRQTAVPQPVIPASSPAPKTEPKIRANTSRPRTYVPPPKTSAQTHPQAPAASLTDPATASSITPKRRTSSATISKPPPTPKSDRNIDKVVLGNICFKTWYPSYYSKEVLGDASGNAGPRDHSGGGAKIGGGKKEKEAMLDRLYVCPSCFKYSKELLSWTGHVKYCKNQAYVPGMKIYTHPQGTTLGAEGEWSVWEVNGERDVLFCQNLSLFAKLFLDNKSVFFDVTGFTYFLLVYTPPTESAGAVSTPSICGFFSKEKMSWDNNNLACILVFPPWQRKGLGALLMGVSYEISKREGIIGGPEKPISELGRKGYKRYWAGEIARWLLGLELEKDHGHDDLLVDLEDCSKATWIAQEDCLAILREMDLVAEAGLGPPKPKQVEGDEEEKPEEQVVEVPRVKLDKAAVRKWVEDNKIDLDSVCDPDGFVEGYAIREETNAEDEEE